MFIQIMSKSKVFLWAIVHDKFLLGDQLEKKGWIEVIYYALCREVLEFHLLL